MSHPVALTGARIFTGDVMLDDHAVIIAGGRIADVIPLTQLGPEPRREALAGGTLAPGFIDAQVNGGGGVLFNATPDVPSLTRLAAAHARHGTTALLPTFITDRPAAMRDAIAAVRDAIAAKIPGIVGLHLEGPFIATARKGAHDASLIRPVTDEDTALLIDCGVRPLLLTVAPETVPPSHIRRLVDAGITVSLGHTDAGYDLVMAAADAGARGVTHLYNAMSQLGHRAPGVVGAALEHGGLWAGLIADRYHVHPAALRIALRAKRDPARLFLVTDAMPTAGDTTGTFTLNGRTVTRSDGRLTLQDGTLAGSDLTMDQAVAYTIATLGQPPEEALRMASLYPAQFLGLDRDRGRIKPGFRADLVHLTPDGSVSQVW